MFNNATHIARLAWEMTKLAFMFNDADSLLKSKNSTAKQLCWSEALALTQVKAVGKQYAATVNDVLCAAIAGALFDYLAEQKDVVHGNKIRAAVAINLRDTTQIQMGNVFGLVALPIPLDLVTPLSRLQQIKTYLTQLKNSHQAYTTEPVLWLIGCLPLPLQRFVITQLMNKYSFVISNLAGPSTIRSLAGAKMTELIFWVPQTGNIGLGISIISYAGKICFGLFADNARIRQPDRIMSLCCQHFQDLAASSS
jgi:WS/DGAT/MGAT family acyltransferase